MFENFQSLLIYELGNKNHLKNINDQNFAHFMRGYDKGFYDILLTTVSKRKSSSKPKHSSFSQRSIEEKKIKDEKQQIGIEDPYIEDPTDYDEFFNENITVIIIHFTYLYSYTFSLTLFI